MVKRGGGDGGKGHEEEKRDRREEEMGGGDEENGLGGSSKLCVCVQGFIGSYSHAVFFQRCRHLLGNFPAFVE